MSGENDFQLIPAIDLLDGSVVRLLYGDYEQRTHYAAGPAEQAEAFVLAGARIVHVVDLNAARTGKRDVNRSAVEEIERSVAGRAVVELGGGIRDMRSLEEALALGVGRAVIGTAAVNDPGFLREALAAHGPQKIIVGVDARDGRVKTAGWESDGGIRTTDLLLRLESDGVAEVIFTDISVDGALTGPALRSIAEVHAATRELRIVASGGVATQSDVELLARADHTRLVGVIVGRAIYEGRLDVARTIQAITAGR